MARFIPSGVVKVVLAPAVAGTSPTRAEINAGVVVAAPGTVADEGLIALNGFESATQNVAVPDASSTFTATIPGRTEANEASMEFYDSDASHTVWTALAENAEKYVLKMPYGDVAGRMLEVWKVRVGARNRSAVNAENNAATVTYTVGISQPPVKDATIPA